MLPEGFKWTERYQYAKDELALKLDDREVAVLMRTIDGHWFAYLERQRPGMAPQVKRDCRSRETGIAGIELWACRHEARLRAEVAAIPRPRHVGAG